ncbi:hypothetical protein O1611_g8735 [Lasiodiplodia mahajangana]|uniref:Uncharacterized protein n=1 Tax=Lasiodiplodia mahajangana TaxID=1108764 RepID=A0ACC2JBS4_9PEZI|nr:hypothetical protein O1611_g8735 [Lasiodiplodia mahajangana]
MYLVSMGLQTGHDPVGHYTRSQAAQSNNDETDIDNLGIYPLKYATSDLPAPHSPASLCSGLLFDTTWQGERRGSTEEGAQDAGSTSTAAATIMASLALVAL